MMAKMYDHKCYELAEHFLKDQAKINNYETADTLAYVIQEAIEGFLHAANHAVKLVSH